MVFRSPAELPAARFALRGIECEFAFQLAADFEPREEPYELEEAAERVSAPIPAIEIVSPRLDHPIRYGAPSAIADCGVNGALVLGAAALDWQALDLATHLVRLEIDGERKAEGTGALVLGHPLNVLTWFVNRYTASGRTLPAGQIVSTGTTTGLLTLDPGQTAIADFGSLGHGRADVSRLSSMVCGPDSILQEHDLLARRDPRHRFGDLWHEPLNVAKPIGGHVDDADAVACQIVLARQKPVARQQHIELVPGRFQQLAVASAFPAMNAAVRTS